MSASGNAAEAGKASGVEVTAATIQAVVGGSAPPVVGGAGELSPSGSFTSAELKSGSVLGKCRIEKEIGRGGMGVVYLARHTVMDVPVAVKTMAPSIAEKNPQFAERFLREIRLASKISHKNAVRVLDAERDEKTGLFYVVQEYVDGGTVRDLLRQGPLQEAQALDIAIGVAEALVAAGEHKIVHRDIKPENIMLTRKGEVKLADLGIAKELAEGEVELTMSHVMMGTPAYMAPEQAMDAKSVDARADLYSLGVSLYHMLCGVTPYAGDTAVSMLSKMMKEPTPDPRLKRPNLSEPLAKLVQRLMAKEPKDRPATAEQALAELKALRETHSTPADLQKLASDLMTEMKAMRADMAGATAVPQATIPLQKTPGAGPAAGGATPPAKKGKGVLWAALGGGCLLFLLLLAVGAAVLFFKGKSKFQEAVAKAEAAAAEQAAGESATPAAGAGVAAVTPPAATRPTPAAVTPPVTPSAGAGGQVNTATTVAAVAAALPQVKVTTEVLWQELPPAPAAVVGTATPPAPEAAAAPRKVAMFVNNRADAVFNDQVASLEDKVIAGLAGADFAPLSKDDTVQALNQFPTDRQGVADRNSLGTQADRLLADQTTALSLARNMGADFLMMVNISTITATAKNLAAAGIQGSLLNYNIAVNYRICDGGSGAALDGGTFNLKKSVRFSGATPAADPAVVEEMMDEAARKVTEKLGASAARIKAQPLPAEVEILIAAAPRDLQGQEISLPDLRLTEDNKIATPTALLPVQLAATVEIDGMAAGTTPTRLRVAPGLHKVRLSRPGFEEVNLTISAKQGLTLNPAMTMSAEGFQRWREVRAFLLALDVTRELSAAQAEAIRGYAQMLRQSGFKVDQSLKVQGDYKSNIKVDTKDAPSFVEKKSIYSVD